MSAWPFHNYCYAKARFYFWERRRLNSIFLKFCGFIKSCKMHPIVSLLRRLRCDLVPPDIRHLKTDSLNALVPVWLESDPDIWCSLPLPLYFFSQLYIKETSHIWLPGLNIMHLKCKFRHLRFFTFYNNWPKAFPQWRLLLSRCHSNMFILPRNLIYEHCLSQSRSPFYQKKLSNQRFGQIWWNSTLWTKGNHRSFFFFEAVGVILPAWLLPREDV